MDSNNDEQNKNLEIIKNILNIEEVKRGKFSIQFTVNELGVVDVAMDWPDTTESQEMVNAISTLLFSVDKNQIQELIMQGLAESSQEDGLSSLINKVISRWAEYESNHKSQPCVKPKDALRK